MVASGTTKQTTTHADRSAPGARAPWSARDSQMSASTIGGWPSSDCGPARPRSAWRAVRWGDIRVAV